MRCHNSGHREGGSRRHPTMERGQGGTRGSPATFLHEPLWSANTPCGLALGYLCGGRRKGRSKALHNYGSVPPDRQVSKRPVAGFDWPTCRYYSPLHDRTPCLNRSAPLATGTSTGTPTCTAMAWRSRHPHVREHCMPTVQRKFDPGSVLGPVGYGCDRPRGASGREPPRLSSDVK